MPAGVTHAGARPCRRRAGLPGRTRRYCTPTCSACSWHCAACRVVQRLSLPCGFRQLPGAGVRAPSARPAGSRGGTPVAVVQCDKCTWEVACDPSRPLELHYQVMPSTTRVRRPGWTPSAPSSTAIQPVPCACRPGGAAPLRWSALPARAVTATGSSRHRPGAGRGAAARFRQLPRRRLRHAGRARSRW